MIKSSAALGFCLAILILSSPFPAEGSKVFSPPHGADDRPAETGDFFAVQEAGASISLPDAEGSWLIQMSRDGGMLPRKLSIQINSEGEVAVISERYTQGRPALDCSLKAKLSAEDLLKLKESVRAAEFSAWRERYEHPKHPVCCDQPTTRLTLDRREAAGAKASYKTSWYPGSSELLPSDLVELATLGQALWNKTSERCEDRRRK
jgi:hypothetical protein